MAIRDNPNKNLTRRTRRTLGGGVRRMGTRVRVLAVVLLCSLAAATLPSCGATSKASKVATEPRREEHSPIVAGQDSNTSGDTAPQTEELGFRMESAPQDSLVKIVYWIPETVYSDSVFVELDFFTATAEAARVAQPVSRTHGPGSYTESLSKRGLPDGKYFARLRINRSNQDMTMRPFNLIWINRK